MINDFIQFDFHLLYVPSLNVLCIYVYLGKKSIIFDEFNDLIIVLCTVYGLFIAYQVAFKFVQTGNRLKFSQHIVKGKYIDSSHQGHPLLRLNPLLNVFIKFIIYLITIEYGKLFTSLQFIHNFIIFSFDLGV